MKKIFIALLIVLSSSYVFATTALYRISSNEVYKISEENDIFAFDVSDQLAVATSVSTPDGDATWDTSGNLRVLGYSKILDGTTVRNATQEEIDTFAAFEAEDRNIKEADQATAYFQNDPKFRRAMIAIIKGIIKEDNEGRLWTRSFMAAVAASTSLANFQSRVAALDTPTDREFSDAKDYILGQISKDD